MKTIEKKQEKLFAQLKYLAQNLLTDKGKINRDFAFPDELSLDDDDDDDDNDVNLQEYHAAQQVQETKEQEEQLQTQSIEEIKKSIGDFNGSISTSASEVDADMKKSIESFNRTF